MQHAVSAAKEAYETKRSDNKAKKWLTKLSSRVLFYSSVLDMLASHHPEYTALVWGSLKFLMRVSDGRIADVLG